MKLILKDRMAFLQCHGYVPNVPLKVDIDIKDFNINDFKMGVKINDLPSRSCVKSFTIPKEELSRPQLNLSVIITHKAAGTKMIFDMDPIKLQEAILVGNNIEEQYPASLKLMMQQVNKIESTTNLIRAAVVEIGKKGEIF